QDIHAHDVHCFTSRAMSSRTFSWNVLHVTDGTDVVNDEMKRSTRKTQRCWIGRGICVPCAHGTQLETNESGLEQRVSNLQEQLAVLSTTTAHSTISERLLT